MQRRKEQAASATGSGKSTAQLVLTSSELQPSVAPVKLAGWRKEASAIKAGLRVLISSLKGGPDPRAASHFLAQIRG